MLSSEEAEISGKKAIKSGFWYTFSSVFCKGIGFLTIPVITRVLGQSNFGLYSNFQNWLSTFTIIVGISLASSLISAKYDYKNVFDKYIESILILESLLALFWFVVFLLFSGVFVKIICIDKPLVLIMLIDVFFISVVDIFQHRAIYNLDYKSSVFVNTILSASIALLSILFALIFSNSLYGAIIGYSIPYIVIGIGIICFLIHKGKGIIIDSWKYAIKVCLPYVPHLLSLTLLNSLDKMMITQIRGSKENALYSVAYNCGIIITILGSAVNSAFSPWLGEKLHKKELSEIRTVTKYYIGIFAGVTAVIMLFGPELILIMGGKSYKEANIAIIPIIMGCLFQFVYTIYVDIEQFEKKTKGMAIASVIAAVLNYILNNIFIPEYGYIAAAYTTLASYFILLILHILLVCRMKLLRACSLKYVVVVFAIMIVFSILVCILYDYSLIRYIVIGFILILCFSVALVYKKEIKQFVLSVIKSD